MPSTKPTIAPTTGITKKPMMPSTTSSSTGGVTTTGAFSATLDLAMGLVERHAGPGVRRAVATSSTGVSVALLVSVAAVLKALGVNSRTQAVLAVSQMSHKGGLNAWRNPTR